MTSVAVIGAGASGLPTIKSCIEEGLNPTCFEMTTRVGGLWNYVEEDCPERATVFRGIIMNTSKELSSFSDFPAPKEFGTFLPHDQYAKYLYMYAQNFGLLNRIQFNHKVLQVKQDSDTPGKWILLVEDVKTGVTLEKSFDYVIVCNGHHCVPNWPSFPGQSAFKGIQIHSQQYRKPETFENKCVLVVGFGNSACDVASECATTAKKVYLASRSKYWLIPRQLTNGTPWDSKILTRLNYLLSQLKSPLALSSIFEKIANNRFDHQFYGVCPKDRFLNHYPVANDVISLQILVGKVILKDGVKYITEDSVYVENESEPLKVDVIIYATGFKPRCEFARDFLDLNREMGNIYKMMFPTNLRLPSTFAFVGLTDTNMLANSVPFEMQARYIARVFSGKIFLPSREVMQNYAEENAKAIKSILGKDTRILTYIDSIPYVEDLAREIGCKPSLFVLLLKDPKLFWAVLVGPFLAAQYRITGPHAWSGARNAILGFKDRFGFHMRKSIKKHHRNGSSFKKTFFIVPAICFIGFFMLRSASNYVRSNDCRPSFLTIFSIFKK